MKEYQPKWSEKHLPHNVYMSVIYIIRDYPRVKALRDSIIDETTPASGGSPAGSYSQPTESKAIRLVELSDKCSAIERALEVVPAEYRDGIMRNIIYQIPYPTYAGKNTWSRWRIRFLIRAAELLHFI